MFVQCFWSEGWFWPPAMGFLKVSWPLPLGRGVVGVLTSTACADVGWGFLSTSWLLPPRQARVCSPRGPGLIRAQAFKGVPPCTQAVAKASVVVWSQRARVPSACTHVLLGGPPRPCRIHPRSSTGPRGGIGEGWGQGLVATGAPCCTRDGGHPVEDDSQDPSAPTPAPPCCLGRVGTSAWRGAAVPTENPGHGPCGPTPAAPFLSL